MTPEVITSLVQKYADPVRVPGFSRKKGKWVTRNYK